MVGPQKDTGIDPCANNLCFKVLEYLCPLPFPAIRKIIPWEAAEIVGLQKDTGINLGANNLYY